MNTVVARLTGAIKRYGTVTALGGVDLQLRGGEVLAVLGANGAGKTTAISLLLGLADADSGSVELFGLAPRELAARRQLGVMLQNVALPDTLRVGELLRLFGSYYPDPWPVAEIAALTGVEALLRRPYRKLSGGQQRRVQFALALVGRPRALFLDEPTVGLDVEARQAFWAVIRAQVAEGCAVLLTTHYLEEAEALADRVVVLAAGRVVAEDTVQALRERGGRRAIRCRTVVPVAVVAAWPEVETVESDRGILSITSDRPELVLRRLFDQDQALTELEVRRAGLADTLIELAREAA